MISISNITTYATQVNRQKINEVIDALQKANQDMNILLNVTDVLTECLRYHQIYTYAHTISAYLRDCLIYMKQVAIHTMHYVDATTSNILSADILPVKELKSMLRHIESQLPLLMHLPISSDNKIHFYKYLKTNVLTVEEQYLLLIDVPIQDRAQLQIYEIFNLPVPHGDMSARYTIQWQIYRNYIQWNTSSSDHWTAVLNMPPYNFEKWIHHSRLFQIHQCAQHPYMPRTTRK